MSVYGFKENKCKQDLDSKFNGDEPMGNIVVGDITYKNVYKATSYRGCGFNEGIPFDGESSYVVINNFDSNNVNISINSNNYLMAISNNMQLESNTTYTISFVRTNTNVNSGRGFLYNITTDGTYERNIDMGNEGETAYTFTTGETGKIAVAFGVDNMSSGATIDVANIQIEKGSVATDFAKNKEFVIKGDFAKVTITHLFNGTFVDEEGYTTASLDVNYPEGFNKENSYVVSSKIGETDGNAYTVVIESNTSDSEMVFALSLKDNGINVCYYGNDLGETVTVVIELLLMKI